MTRTRFLTSLAGAAAISLAALAVTACGASTTNSSRPADPNATVSVASTGLGSVLVDSKGRTLYLFEKDAGAMSSCAGACATLWPPLRVKSMPTAGGGAKASLVSSSARPDGGTQVTYNGHPLYRYAGDMKPGDTKGQDLTAYGASWYALGPAG